MRFYINRVPVRGPWGGGNMWLKAAYKEIAAFGHEVLNPNDFNARPDVIMLAGLENDGDGISAEQAIMYKMYMQNCKLIVRVNENDTRKGTNYVDDLWIKVSEYVDGTVFVSSWLKDYFISRGWKCQNTIVIHNGVNKDIFKPNVKFNNGKVNIVTHHWSDNRNKGADVYELIDEFVGNNSNEYSFTYIGRHRCTFKNTNVIKPLFGASLGEELGKYDVYVSASRFDPGPNHVCEPISCELPTYVHVEGGGAVEFAGLEHVFSDWNSLKEILLKKNFKKNVQKFSDWNSCIEKYVKFIEQT